MSLPAWAETPQTGWRCWLVADMDTAQYRNTLRRNTAYHEAGHAIVFAALGVSLDYVVIDAGEARPDSNGYCSYDYESFQRLSPRIRALPAVAGDAASALSGFWSLEEVDRLYLDAWEDEDIAEMLETDWPRIRINLEVADDPNRRVVWRRPHFADYFAD